MMACVTQCVSPGTLYLIVALVRICGRIPGGREANGGTRIRLTLSGGAQAPGRAAIARCAL